MTVSAMTARIMTSLRLSWERGFQSIAFLRSICARSLGAIDIAENGNEGKDKDQPRRDADSHILKLVHLNPAAAL